MKNFLNLSKVKNYWIRKILFLRYYLSKFYKNFVYLYIYMYKEIKYKRHYWIKFNKIGINFLYEIISKLIYLN